MDAGSEKDKTIVLTTTISVHDLENKKKQAIQFLKKVGTLKVQMKVNKYDPDNIKKGRLMLINIAEDLKSYAKVKVSPMIEEKKQEETEKQDVDVSSFSTFEQAAEQKQKETKDKSIDVSHHEEESDESGRGTVVMELESTVNFEGLDVDLDNMIENSTLEEFLQHLQITKPAEDTDKATGQNNLLGGIGIDDSEVAKDKPELHIDTGEAQLQSRIKMKKQLRKQSAIFDALDDSEAASDKNIVDLTKYAKSDGQKDDVNDYDLLDAEINPLDVETIERVEKLRVRLIFDEHKDKMVDIWKKFKARKFKLLLNSLLT